jgi:hypothetical protein
MELKNPQAEPNGLHGHGFKKAKNDKHENEWTKGTGMRVYGTLEGIGSLQKIPADTKVIGRWVRSVPISSDRWRIKQHVYEEIKVEDKIRELPMRHWILRLLREKPLKETPVRYVNRRVSEEQACVFNEAINKYLVTPGETLGIRLGTDGEDILKNRSSMYWPKRKCWWRGHTAGGEPFIFAEVDNGTVQEVEGRFGRLPGFKLHGNKGGKKEKRSSKEWQGQ